jgi:hypothetical protein
LKFPRKFLIVFSVAFVSSFAGAIERDAFTFTNYTLRVQLDAAQHGFAATGTVTLRNDSQKPQKNVVLQISSGLQWNAITSGHKKVAYVTHPYSSDVDHTGVLSEAVVTLPQPLARGASVDFEISYGGAIALDTTRLEQMGTPKAVAAANDWDRVSPDFIGLRGIGYVAWYPISLDDLSLSDGQEYSAALAAWRERHAQTKFVLQVHAAQNETALFNGGHAEVTANADATFPEAEIGENVPTLIVAPYMSTGFEQSGTRDVLYYSAADKGRETDYQQVAEAAAAALRQSFGMSGSATLVELPEGNDAPFETGNVLLAPFITSDTRESELIIIHEFARAMLMGPNPAAARHPWIYEGVAGYAQALLREREDGRDAAIAWMALQRDALIEEESQNKRLAALTAPAKPFSDASTSLLAGTDEVLYRTKAMYVWWMLHEMLGEGTVARAIQKYKSGDDARADYMQRLLEQQAQTDHVVSKMPLEQFFDDWVYRDRGLPDFTIASTYARKILAAAGGDNYLVTVTVKNLGDAGAEIPVTVICGVTERVTRRIAVPARGEASVRIPTVSAPDRAIVNDGSVPESDMGNNSELIQVTPGAPSSP